MFTPSASVSELPNHHSNGVEVSSNNNNNTSNGQQQYYAGSSSLGQETDVMHQYYTDHGHDHHHHHLSAGPLHDQSAAHSHHYHPHAHTHHLPAHHLGVGGGAGRHHHHHHYPLAGTTTTTATTESSLSSSAFMTRSALRLSALFGGCCSKRCLLILCLSLILLIFILVISLSAYLNFLINANKTSLSPLSGRLRVLNQQLAEPNGITNRTSLEFLARQREYEIILRGALDRTQNLLKTYPNHLVKLEVYAFKPTTTTTTTAATATFTTTTASTAGQTTTTGLWVYYRLFLNKKSLAQDGQLMKRKSPDEHLERQFLPRLTQQSLQSGFEQLLATFNGRQSRSISARQQQQAALKSFDDQISRLMPIVESIDLQSIQVSHEFDMLALESSLPEPESGAPQSMSDNLRASQPLATTTTTSATTANTIMVATGRPTDSFGPTERVRESIISPESATNQRQQEVSKKFTLYGYKENSTRPNGGARQQQQQQEGGGSLFLVNHQQQKPTTSVRTPTNGQMAATNQRPALISANNSNSSASPNLAASSNSHSAGENRTASGNTTTERHHLQQVVKLVAGQPVQRAHAAAGADSSLARGNLPDDKSASPTRLSQADPNSPQIAKAGQQQSSASSSLFVGQPVHDSSARQKSGSRSAASGGRHAATGNNGSATVQPPNETPLMQMVAPYQKIEFSSTAEPALDGRNSSNGQSLSRSNGTTGSRDHQDSPATQSPSVLELWNRAVASNSPARHRGSSQQHHADESGQGLISVGSPIGQANKKRKQHSPNETLEWQKIHLLSSDISDTIRAELVNSATVAAAAATTTTTEQPAAQLSGTQKPAKVAPHLNQGGSLIVVASNRPAKEQSAILLNRDFKQQQPKPNKAHQDKGQQASAGGGERQPVVSATVQPTSSSSSTVKPARQKQPSGNSNKKKKVSSQQQATNETSAMGANLQQTTRGIKIVDNFLATLEATTNNNSNINNNNNKTVAASRQHQQQHLQPAQGAGPGAGPGQARNKSQEAFNYNADNLAPTLPTTIELTRSTTSSPPSLAGVQTRTSSSSAAAAAAAALNASPGRQQEATLGPHQLGGDVDFTTTASSATGTVAQGSILSSLASSLSGTTESRQPTNRDRSGQLASTWPTVGGGGGGGQWRPMASATANSTGQSQSVNLSQRKPIASATVSTTQLIVPGGARVAASTSAQFRRPTSGVTALATSVNQPAGGSQSPFAMSILAELADNSNNDDNNGDGNTTRAVHYAGANESTALFESHRTSRMSQSAREAARQGLMLDQLLNSSSSSSSSSSSIGNLDPTSANEDNEPHRMVDDFMITPDQIVEGNTRGTTLIPPLVLSGLGEQRSVAGARLSPEPATGSAPNRPKTRGPFAFETLKEFAPQVAVDSPSQPEQGESGLAAAARLVERSLAAPLATDANSNSNLDSSANANGKLAERMMVRKRLFLGGNADEPDLSAAADPVNFGPAAAAAANPIEGLASSPLLTGKGLAGESDISPASRLEARHQNNQPHEQWPAGNDSGNSNNNNNYYYRLDRFGVRKRPASLVLLAGRQIPASAVRIIMRKQHNKEGDSSDSDSDSDSAERNDNSAGQPAASDKQADGANPLAQPDRAHRGSGQQHPSSPFRCQYYGCKSKVDGKFVCLNGTQICDDFIDCQDESDELNCVSLLKYDDSTPPPGGGPTTTTKRGLSFSNGAGIIYLNRRGSLAPMCIDYFHPNDQRPAAKNHPRQQEELIRQINTIGQYACSLQSFSKLVSVKINHHNLVDGLDLIKSSKLYHRLSIVGPSQSSSGSLGANSPSGRPEPTAASPGNSSSFRSGSSEHQVEISTSPNCPSQRTVFVKCGDFECGQDSFSIIQDQNDDNNNNNNRPARRRNGVIMNNFPWLVKLYWMGSLACHGYLIDELWLISSSECFVNKATQQPSRKTTSDDENGQPTGAPPTDNSGWTAELSYEHYGGTTAAAAASGATGNDDDDEHRSAPIASGASSRRNINEILMQANGAQEPHLGSPIVLAKLEEPVRFSPSNRPICLPLSPPSVANNNRTALNSDTLHYRDCYTIGLPSPAAAAAASSASSSAAAPGIASNNGSAELNNAPTQRATLNKVKVHEIINCFADSANAGRPTRAALNRATTNDDHEQVDGRDRVVGESAGQDYSNLICVSDDNEKPAATSRLQSSAAIRPDDNGRLTAQQANTKTTNDGDDLVRALICSTTIQQASRSRPKWTVVGVQYKVPELQKQLLSPDRHIFARVSSQIDWIVDTMNPKFSNLHPEDNNSSDDPRVNLRIDGPPIDRSGACNKFRCSSGECLSWSRICDGLYDCSSQDDERDCHK